jgi:hypothetical protein
LTFQPKQLPSEQNWFGSELNQFCSEGNYFSFPVATEIAGASPADRDAAAPNFSPAFCE